MGLYPSLNNPFELPHFETFICYIKGGTERIIQQNNELYNLYTIFRNMCLVTKSSSTVNNFSYGPVLKFEQTYVRFMTWDWLILSKL